MLFQLILWFEVFVSLANNNEHHLLAECMLFFSLKFSSLKTISFLN